MKEGDFSRKLINILKQGLKDIYIKKNFANMYTGAGQPDITISYQGRFIAIETKLLKKPLPRYITENNGICKNDNVLCEYLLNLCSPMQKSNLYDIAKSGSISLLVVYHFTVKKIYVIELLDNDKKYCLYCPNISFDIFIKNMVMSS